MLDDPPQYHDEVRRKARKQHTCRECRLTIEPGETYSYGTGLQDGRWYNYKLCNSCRQWAEVTGVATEGWTLGDLAYEIAQRFDCTPYDGFRRTSPSVYYVTPESQDGEQQEAQTQSRIHL